MEELVFDFEKQPLTYPLDKEHKQEYPSSKNFPYKHRIQLDLHDCSLENARQNLQNLLQNTPRKKGISLLIITGKGLNSGEKGPVIKNFTKKYLTDNAIQWKVAPPKKGGTGVIIAYL